MRQAAGWVVAQGQARMASAGQPTPMLAQLDFCDWEHGARGQKAQVASVM